MDSSKLVVKFFVRDMSGINPHTFVPVFHSLIQMHAVEDHLLIDVADYEHVEGGPGTVLVAHEGNFYTERTGNQLGLAYWRKQALPGTLTDRLHVVFATALKACARLEEDERFEGKLRFRTDEAIFRINDRLLAPNTAQTFAEIRPELEGFLVELYGAPVQLEHRASPKELFEIKITAKDSPTAAAMLDRLASVTPAGKGL